MPAEAKPENRPKNSPLPPFPPGSSFGCPILLLPRVCNGDGSLITAAIAAESTMAPLQLHMLHTTSYTTLGAGASGSP